MSKGKKGYEVGYGKPPKDTRFKKGQSGNPKGRPKGRRNLKNDVLAALTAPVKVSEQGRAKTVTTQFAILLRLREKALTGDARALDLLLALARSYNSEEVEQETQALPAEDREILDTYLQKLADRSNAKTQRRNGKPRRVQGKPK
ncbi:MAG: DUF5681 domain-containing protein [Rhodovibrionaceae bacterium]